MCMTSFENATTYAHLTALAAALKGKALTTACEAIGAGFLRSQPPARKRQALVSYYARALDSAAIVRMVNR